MKICVCDSNLFSYETPWKTEYDRISVKWNCLKHNRYTLLSFITLRFLLIPSALLVRNLGKDTKGEVWRLLKKKKEIGMKKREGILKIAFKEKKTTFIIFISVEQSCFESDT